VLITPGAHFGIGKYIRFGYGYDINKTLRGLEQVDRFLAEIGGKKAAARKRPVSRRARAVAR